jgi:tetratricopeptide (TPR) repeat protein
VRTDRPADWYNPQDSMSDPLRSDGRALELLSGEERTARIEQLLLTGLDHYFAGDYDQAVNLWTRVLFLDRQHDRARAYIERARSAQAEGQRECEALLHEGLQAFSEGAVDRARELLQAAIDRGAPHDMALGVLDRIERLEVGQTTTGARRAADAPARARVADPGGGTPGRSKVAATISVIGLVLVVLTAAGAWEFSVGELSSTGRQLPQPVQPQAGPTLPAEALPSTGAFEADLARAQRHFAAGRLHEAVAALDRVPIGDPLHVEAERLRERVQRELLRAAEVELAPPPSPAKRPPDE